MTIAAFLAFSAGASLSAGDGVEAQDAPVVVDPDATPVPGEQPDFTKDFWYQKWLNREAQLPRYDQVVSGIEVGPDVIRSGGPCNEQDRPVQIPFEDARLSRVDIQFGYVPEGFVVSTSGAVSCGGAPALAEVIGSIAAADESEIRARLKSGESFFDVPHGSRLSVIRLIGDPAIESGIASTRWIATDIAGFPVAVGRPIFDEGFGESEVIIYSDGVITVVRASDLSLAELLKVAEGLMR